MDIFHLFSKCMRALFLISWAPGCVMLSLYFIRDAWKWLKGPGENKFGG